MAVAETKPTETSGPSLLDRLPVASLAGLAYVLGSLGVIFGLLPYLAWDVFGLPADSMAAHAALIVLMLLAGAGLAFLGVRLLGSHPMPGLKAGIFTALVGLLLTAIVARWVGSWLEKKVYEDQWFSSLGGPVFGQMLALTVAIALGVLFFRWFFRPQTEIFLKHFENQGWFSTHGYKPGQGNRVRRGTILGILVLVGCGLYLMVRDDKVGKVGSWALNVPFSGKVRLTEAGDLSYAVDRLKANGLDDEAQAILNAVNDGKPISMDRFTVQEINRLALNPKSFRRIGSEGGRLPDVFRPLEARSDHLRFEPNQIVDQTTYEEAVEALKAEDKRVNGANAQPAEVERLAGIAAPRTRELKGDLNYASLTILPNVRFTLPLLLGVLALWFAWRVVNLPTFADFLIATEAEMHKVSWTSRSKLYQDTIVVLATLFLMTLFLFLVDITWSKLLSWRVIGVLQVPEASEKSEGTELKW